MSSLPRRAFNPSLPPSDRASERARASEHHFSLFLSFFCQSAACNVKALSPPSNLYMSHGHEWGLDSGTAAYTTHDQNRFKLRMVEGGSPVCKKRAWEKRVLIIMCMFLVGRGRSFPTAFVYVSIHPSHPCSLSLSPQARRSW